MSLQQQLELQLTHSSQSLLGFIMHSWALSHKILKFRCAKECMLVDIVETLFGIKKFNCCTSHRLVSPN